VRLSDSLDNEIEHLLPFYVTGKLSMPDRLRVEKALQRDTFLSDRLELVLEEQAVTVQAGGELGRPRQDAVDRFFARLHAEPFRSGLRPAQKHLLDWLARLASLVFAPRAFPYAGLAAGIVVIAQAAVIGSLLTRPQTLPAPWKPQFLPEAHQGCFAIAAFNPEAKLSEVAARLQAVQAVIVDGPKPSGLYLLRLGSNLSAAECDGALSMLGAEKDLIRYVKRTI
jgi:hypothetical protein